MNAKPHCKVITITAGQPQRCGSKSDKALLVFFEADKDNTDAAFLQTYPGASDDHKRIEPGDSPSMSIPGRTIRLSDFFIDGTEGDVVRLWWFSNDTSN